MLNNRIVIVSLFVLTSSFLANALSFNWGFSALKSSDAAIDDDRSSRSYKIVCYYTNWAQYRPKPGAFFPENVDPKLCTHIIFAFAKLSDAYELQSFEWNDESTEWSKGMYERIVQLKQLNKDLKVLIAVGGWNHGSLPFSNMVSDSARRSNFVAKTVEFLKKHSFDGLDLDWEYPANRDTENRPDDKIYFTILCKELYAAFRPHGYLLTAAVAAGIKYMHTGYEIGEIHKYLSFINIMAYDLHGAWENVTGHNAPLYKHTFDKDPTLNIDYAVKAWLEGVPSDKLVLGLATYGRSYQLKEGFESCPLTDTPSSKAGTSGKFSREDGFLTYYEVCEKLLTENWKYVWNDQQKVPYAYSNELFSSTSGLLEWVGFDDVRSIEAKSKYIMDRKLGGAMIWSLDMDDFTGTFCNQGKYPLLSTVNYYLNPTGSVQSLPTESRIRKKNTGDVDSRPPKTEYDFFKEFSERKASQGSFNVFSLIQNDVMQVYKYCQCKNGTQKINADHNDDTTKPDDRYTYIVDCNRKRVYPASSYVETGSTPTTTFDDANDNDRTNIWTIFNTNSATSGSQQPTFICMFVLIYFYYLFF